MAFDKLPPLTFFDTLLEPNGYNICKNNTISSVEESVKGYLESVDYDKGEISFWHYDHESGETELTTYSFEKELPKKIEEEITKAKNCIDSLTLEIDKKGNSHEVFLKSQVKHIFFLLDKLSRAEVPNNELVRDFLEGLKSYLIDRYSIKHTNRRHPVESKSSSSYFDLKTSIKMSLIEELYNVTVDLEIIDDEVVSEEAFINVLTGHPSESGDVIVFKCNNQLAVHFIDSIQAIFNNFTYSQISKSEQFFNSKPKVLNQADLDNAKTRVKRSSSNKIENITKVFTDIIGEL